MKTELDPSILKEFEKETLASEKLRATTLGIFFTIAALAFSGAPLIFVREFFVLFSGYVATWIPPVFFAGVAAYCFGVRTLISWFMKTDRAFPTFGRYMNSLVETSVPTLVIWFLAQYRESPIYMLLAPPSFVYFVFIITSALRLDFKLCLFTGFVAAIEYGALAYAFFSPPDGPFGYLVAPGALGVRMFFLAATGIITGLVTVQIRRRLFVTLAANAEKNRIASIFGQHVSPAVVDRLLAQNTELLSESRHVCMLFLDIRNFTAFAEKKSPEAVVGYLNTLFDFMIEIINARSGIINKFLGDGFMAVFGAPESSGQDAENAVAAALEILDRINKEAAAGKIPLTRIGMGLHAGVALAGIIGSSGKREYTIIGDVVNLASRIEQLNKNYDSQILVSEDVWNAMKDKKGNHLGEVMVKGRDVPVQLYRLA